MDLDLFKQQMAFGMGRCYVTLRDAQDKEPYREAVQWGLTHYIGFEHANERSRGNFLFSLACLFDDPQCFLHDIIRTFFDTDAEQRSFIEQMCDELKGYATAGYAEATQALRAMLLYLMDADEENGRFVDYDLVHSYCYTLCSLLTVATDDMLVEIGARIGALLQKAKAYPPRVFLDVFRPLEEDAPPKGLVLLYDAIRQSNPEAADELDELLNPQPSETSEEENDEEEDDDDDFDFDDFFDDDDDDDDEDEIDPTSRRLLLFRSCGISYDLRLDDMVSVNDDPMQDEFAVAAIPDVPQKLADAFTSATHPNDWYRALQDMGRLRYTGDPLPIIVLFSARPGSGAMRALDVLMHMRHPQVLHLATERVKLRPSRSPSLMYAMVHNDSPDCHKTVVKALADMDRDCHGGDAQAVRAALLPTTAVVESEGYGIHLPRDLYEFAYEHAVYTQRRYEAVRIMEGKGWLTPEMIEESRYDANDKLRAYVNRKYPVHP